MLKAPVPPDEDLRLLALAQLHILDTPPEERFDRITRLALRIFQVPISTLTLIDSEREWFKSCQGLEAKEGERAVSFCGHAMFSEGPFIIPDASKDARFADNPLVIGPPHIRFYAGVPLRSIDGQRVGVFCIKDTVPKNLDAQQADILRALGTWAELELNFHELGRALDAQQRADAKVTDANKMLKLLNVILRHDILNDLAVIKGSLSLLAETKDDKYVAESLNVIERSIHLIEMMRDVESAILLESALRPFKLVDVIKKVQKGYPEITFVINGDCSIMADEALYSVFENLVRNAKMHADATHIEVSMRYVGDDAEFSVANDGKNMPAEAKTHLFQEGFAFGKTGRTGLGLYIVNKTIERYRGTVKMEDNKPSGTRFVFTVPRAK